MVNLIYLFFILFPLGQILKIGLINPVDIVVLIVSGNFILTRSKIPVVVRNLCLLLGFSLLFSLTIFRPAEILLGALYLIRLVAYLLFLLQINSWILSKMISREFVLRSLLIVGMVIAFAGLFQYFTLPDTRFLRNFGWDDHYYRLISTFLDPAFTGILLVLTYIISLVNYLKFRSQKFLLVAIILLITIALTYSRASYLGVFGTSLYLFIQYRKKSIILLAILFLISIPFLPRPAGEGVRLERVYSVNQKLLNYQESLILIAKSPVFGLGFDNICIAKYNFLGKFDAASHACSGLDNSFLFILATSGVIGSIGFLYFISWLVKNSLNNSFGIILKTSLIAIGIHGLFTNTLFYNFILGWVGCLIAIGISFKE